MCRYIDKWMHRYVDPSIHPPNNPFHPSIKQRPYLFNLFIHPPIRAPTHPFIHRSIDPPIPFPPPLSLQIIIPNPSVSVPVVVTISSYSLGFSPQYYSFVVTGKFKRDSTLFPNEAPKIKNIATSASQVGALGKLPCVSLYFASYLSVHLLRIYQSSYLRIYLRTFLLSYLAISLCIHLSMYMSIYHSIHPSIHHIYNGILIHIAPPPLFILLRCCFAGRTSLFLQAHHLVWIFLAFPLPQPPCPI